MIQIEGPGPDAIEDSLGPRTTSSISVGPGRQVATTSQAGGEARRVGPVGSRREQRGRVLAAHVVDGEVVAGAQELPGHGPADAADADEPDLHRPTARGASPYSA